MTNAALSVLIGLGLFCIVVSPFVLFVSVKLAVFAFYSAKHAAQKHYEQEGGT